MTRDLPSPSRKRWRGGPGSPKLTLMHPDTEDDSTQAGRPGILDFWREGEVWFRGSISANAPWGDESLLPEVPEAARGRWGLQLAEAATVEGEPYGSGQFVTVSSREELRRLVGEVKHIEGLVFPWYDRLVPPALWAPHFRQVDLASYRAMWGRAWLKAFLITAALTAVAFWYPQFKFLALIAAVFYGIFPLVEATMGWFRRVDRFSVPFLNRQLVNHELFRRWMLEKPTWILKLGVGVLALVFVGQLAVDHSGTAQRLPPSIEAAALLKSAVLEQGEWWRTVTTGLMHGGIIHIVFNGLALFNLGRVITALVSPAVLGIVFLSTVVTGSLASLYFGNAPASVGASGGILGCLGFLLVVCQKFHHELPDYLRTSLLQATIVVTIFGLLGAGFIDNAAHAGGFLGGVAIGVCAWGWLRIAPKRSRPSVRLLGWGSLAVLLAGVAKVFIELAAL